MKTQPPIHIKSRLEYDPWTCPESYSPEPVAPSFRDVLSGISDALGEWIADPRFVAGAMCGCMFTVAASFVVAF